MRLAARVGGGVAGLGRFGLVVVLVAGGAGARLCARGEEPLPAATEVIQKMIERARGVARAPDAPEYTYEMRSVLHSLDSSLGVTKSVEKWYRVTQKAGIPYARLVRITGKELSQKELDKAAAEDWEFRRKFVKPDDAPGDEPDHGWLTAELLGRYIFRVIERQEVRDRPTLILAYEPDPARNTGHTGRDKILGRVAGTLWVDAQEFEVARLEVKLLGSVPLGWLGILGSLHEFDLTLERQRMPEGVWVNTRQEALILGRKLVFPMRYRLVEDSRDIQLESGEPTRAP